MKFSKITISGKICTGKTTLLNDLQEKLNWPTFLTGKYFRNYVKQGNLLLEKVEEQNERLTKEIDYKVRDLLHKKANLIVDGWMSGIMADSLPEVLKILLVCDDEIRYQRFAKREKISLKDAGKKVEERQNNWFEKMEKIYKMDSKEFIDPKNYDLIIDTTNISSEDVLKKVSNSL